MKLEIQTPSSHVLTIGDSARLCGFSVAVLFSYGLPYAFVDIENDFLCSRSSPSKTTSAHINKFVRRFAHEGPEGHWKVLSDEIFTNSLSALIRGRQYL